MPSDLTLISEVVGLIMKQVDSLIVLIYGMDATGCNSRQEMVVNSGKVPG